MKSLIDYGLLLYIYLVMVLNETDEKVLSVKEEPENGCDSGARPSSATLWWDFGNCRCKRAQWESSNSNEPDICDEVKGLHFGKTG